MLNLLYQRRSIKCYLPKPVEEEKVQQLIRAALLAPSGKGIYSQKFILVNNKELLEKLSRAREAGSGFLKDAPLAMVILGDSKASDVWTEDASIAAIIVQLTAKSIGLDSRWSQVRLRQHNQEKTAEQYIQEVLVIPEHLKVECMIAIGYADESQPARTDEDLKFDRVSFNSYQN